MLLDLDGTLSDSAPGILASLRHSFDAHSLPQLTDVQARGMLGPPFTKSLARYVEPALIDEVISTYRVYYREQGMFDATVYAGIPDLLTFLTGVGVTMAVATSKLEPFAVPIVEHLGLADFFETVCGDAWDASRDSKALVIAEALGRLNDPDPSTVLMVGDRIHDVEGAAAHSIACAGAGWGYGVPEELAGAVSWHPTPRDLLRAMGG